MSVCPQRKGPRKLAHEATSLIALRNSSGIVNMDIERPFCVQRDPSMSASEIRRKKTDEYNRAQRTSGILTDSEPWVRNAQKVLSCEAEPTPKDVSSEQSTAQSERCHCVENRC